MLTLQQALTAASLSFARTFALLPAVRAVSALHRAELLTLLPIVLLYQANVVFALAGLSALSVPVYNVVKRGNELGVHTDALDRLRRLVNGDYGKFP